MSTPGFDRRDFLKLVGIGVAGAATGCAAPPAQRLIPYLVPPKDIMPGVPYWYASTCQECPAGCGVLVKTREGRAIKIEGNPDHPINHGGLCSRGQAALQGLYHPDRVAAPMQKVGGTWKKIAWNEALTLASQRLAEARRNQRGVALITDHRPGSFDRLSAAWASGAGATRLVYEPFAPVALLEANRRSFGRAAVPTYDFERAHYVISFGADFLDTWISPAGYARGFAATRGERAGATFVAVEPRLSLTGSNADEWLAPIPGTELAVALGLVHVIAAEGLGTAAGGAEAASRYTPEEVQRISGVPAETLIRVARGFAAARPSLAVAGGIAAQSEQSVALITAVNLLNQVAGNVGQTVRFDQTWNHESVGTLADLRALGASMAAGQIDVAVIAGANPAYAAPKWTGFADALAKVPFKVAIGTMADETAELCDLLLPARHWLETFGDSEAVNGVRSMAQPVMQGLPMFDARPAGDVLIALAKGAGFGSFPETWEQYLKGEWRGESSWAGALAKGGAWQEASTTGGGGASFSGASSYELPAVQGQGDLTLVVYPSSALYDGRGADKPWLQELPDPTTKAVWGSWVEVHPETAKRLGLRQGDAVKVETQAGAVEVPVYLYSGVRPDVIAIPLGQGHTALGRYAKDRGVNAVALLPAPADAAAIAVPYLSTKARVTKIAKVLELSVTQREKYQHGRDFAQIVPLSALTGGATHAATGAGGAHGETQGEQDTVGTDGHATAAPTPGGAGTGAAHGTASGEHHEPHPSQTRLGAATEPRALMAGEQTPAHAVTAYEPHERVRHPRQIPISQGSYAKGKHRWAMAIDLDRCTGCSACVTACQAENNIPVVGPSMVQRGREMFWLRIDRWEERLAPGQAPDVRHQPMLCQHCGDAPCEIVCPVYATYHNYEGLNAQIYNRCVGTRYCSNNCPYKVRAFNWFDYTAPEKATFAFPEPLNWQLNPDVTVRSKGVMEKCTFCVQRILEGKGNAKDEGRPLRDGEIQSACQQSCPSQAIVFGDLMDPDSQVSRLSREGGRRYWALNELNTKPAVTYLKKVSRSSEVPS